MKYFSFRHDFSGTIAIPVLDGPKDINGESLDHGEFHLGKKIESTRLIYEVMQPGTWCDLFLDGFSIPLASHEMKENLSEICGARIDFIPCEVRLEKKIIRPLKGIFAITQLPLIEVIDWGNSETIKWENGTVMSVIRAVYTKERRGSWPHFFRPKGNKVHLILSEKILDAAKSSGLSIAGSIVEV